MLNKIIPEDFARSLLIEGPDYAIAKPNSIKDYTKLLNELFSRDL